jgi:hypothetical protein
LKRNRLVLNPLICILRLRINTNKDLFFISENTPFDSYITDCFIIKYNNEHTVDFDGRFVKKIDHTEIIQLKAGETISKIIPVSESYQISKKWILFNIFQ